MSIGVVGINHSVAPIEIREAVSFTDTQKIEAINILLDRNIDEVVILSTCNRSEIYFKSDNIDEGICIVSKFFDEFFSIKNINKFIIRRKNNEAISHLFNVCTGLDSLVLGEDQVLGQVVDAHEFSMTIGATKKILNKIFREAITTAKEIKNKTKISEKPLSISYIGVKFLKEKIGTFKDKKALIIGYGNMNKLTIKYLQEQKIGKIYLSNRNHRKIKDIEDINIIPIEYKDRYLVLNEVDIVISATSSPHTIIKKEKIPKINKKLYIMDIALPRDIDPSISEFKNIELYDIDNLKEIQSINKEQRKNLSEVAKEIINKKIIDLNLWIDNCMVDMTIGSLNDRCEVIRKDTLNYIFKKIELDNRDKKIIDKMLTSALKRVIREPIINLKNIQDDSKRNEIIKIVENLFEI